MSNYSLPLFMQVKENAVSDLNKNLNLYMPKLVFARAHAEAGICQGVYFNDGRAFADSG